MPLRPSLFVEQCLLVKEGHAFPNLRGSERNWLNDSGILSRTLEFEAGMNLLSLLGLGPKKAAPGATEPSTPEQRPAHDNVEQPAAAGASPSSDHKDVKEGAPHLPEVDPYVLISESLSQKSDLLEKSNILHRRTVLMLLGLNAVTALGWLKAAGKEREFLYFFTNTDGSVIDARPMTDPIHSQAVIRNFLASSLAELFSFHYRNVQEHLQRVSPDILTDRAFTDLANELERMGLVREMVERREVAVGTVPDTPVLTASGTQNGVRTWEYAARITIILEGAERSSGSSNRGRIRQLSGQLRAQVTRVPPEVHPRRILINRIQIFEGRS